MVAKINAKVPFDGRLYLQLLPHFLHTFSPVTYLSTSQQPQLGQQIFVIFYNLLCSIFYFLHLQLGHVPPEPVVPHTIRFSCQSFFQHSSQTMIRPKSLWSAESKVRSSPFFPQSLHSAIFLTFFHSICFHFLILCLCIKINLMIKTKLDDDAS